MHTVHRLFDNCIISIIATTIFIINNTISYMYVMDIYIYIYIYIYIFIVIANSWNTHDTV